MSSSATTPAPSQESEEIRRSWAFFDKWRAEQKQKKEEEEYTRRVQAARPADHPVTPRSTPLPAPGKAIELTATGTISDSNSHTSDASDSTPTPAEPKPTCVEWEKDLYYDIPMHSPLVYQEDYTFACLTEEDVRAKVRAWKALQERRHGIYNVDLGHHCSAECFDALYLGEMETHQPATISGGRPKRRSTKRRRIEAPAGGASEDVVPGCDEEEKGHDKRDEPEEEGEEEEAIHDAKPTLKRSRWPRVTIEVIDQTLALYGCPRSLRVHCCSLDIDVRQRECPVLSEDSDGNTICRFSGRLLWQAYAVYNPYEDSTVSFNQMQTHDTRATREAIAVGGERGRTEREVRRGSEIQTMRRQSETKAGIATRRALKSFAERRHVSAPTAEEGGSDHYGNPPAAEPSVGQPFALIFHPPTSDKGGGTGDRRGRRPSRGRRGGGGFQRRFGGGLTSSGKPAKLVGDMVLPFGLRIALEARRQIGRVVSHVLCDIDANSFARHDVPTLARRNGDDARFIDLCLMRASIIFALIHGLRQAGVLQGGPPDPREVTLTTLYTYARGFNLDAGKENLIPPDERLRRQLPPPKMLPWYGLRADLRPRILEAEVARLPLHLVEAASSTASLTQTSAQLLRKFQLYKASMASAATRDLQVVIRTALTSGGVGLEMMRQILNVASVTERAAYCLEDVLEDVEGEGEEAHDEPDPSKS
jgi:hypothetical protein